MIAEAREKQVRLDLDRALRGLVTTSKAAATAATPAGAPRDDDARTPHREASPFRALLQGATAMLPAAASDWIAAHTTDTPPAADMQTFFSKSASEIRQRSGMSAGSALPQQLPLLPPEVERRETNLAALSRPNVFHTSLPARVDDVLSHLGLTGSGSLKTARERRSATPASGTEARQKDPKELLKDAQAILRRLQDSRAAASGPSSQKPESGDPYPAQPAESQRDSNTVKRSSAPSSSAKPPLVPTSARDAPVLLWGDHEGKSPFDHNTSRHLTPNDVNLVNALLAATPQRRGDHRTPALLATSPATATATVNGGGVLRELASDLQAQLSRLVEERDALDRQAALVREKKQKLVDAWPKSGPIVDEAPGHGRGADSEGAPTQRQLDVAHTIMSKVDQALQQIESNRRSVAAKIDQVNRQLRAMN